MRKVAGAQHGDPFAARPPGEVLEVTVPAASARESGVDVQVGVEHTVVVRSPVIACGPASARRRRPIRYCHAALTPEARLRHGGLDLLAPGVARPLLSAGRRPGPRRDRPEWR